MNETIILEKDTWYWYTAISEGDVFYPLYVRSDGVILVDGKEYLKEDLGGALIYKAIMPNVVESEIEKLKSQYKGDAFFPTPEELVLDKLKGKLQ